MLEDGDVLITRNECRALGLNVSNTQFQRYEKQRRLTAHKADGVRNARVRYLRSQVLAFLGLRP